MFHNPITRVLWRISQSKVLRKIARAFGINDPLNKGFKKTLVFLSGDPTTISIYNSTAQYRVTSVSEYSILNKQSEKAIIEDVLEKARADDVFWDVGANIGLYTCLVTPKVSHTIAFEPFPDNASRLQENIKLNGLEQKAEVYQYALSNRTQIGRLQVVNKNVGTGQNRIVEDDNCEEGINIKEKKGADLVRNGVPSPTVIKVDVEGAEQQVIEGFEDIFSSVRLIYCEIHDDGNKEDRTSAIVDNLERYNFDIELVLDRGDQKIIRGEKSGDHFLE